MSNRKSDEKSDHRKPKVSLAMFVNQGLCGPKANPKGLADAQPVNIPALLYHFYMGTEVSNLSILLDLCSLHKDFSKCWENLFLWEKKFRRAIFLEKPFKFNWCRIRTANRHR